MVSLKEATYWAWDLEDRSGERNYFDTQVAAIIRLPPCTVFYGWCFEDENGEWNYCEQEIIAPALNKGVHFMFQDDCYECIIVEWKDILGWRIEGDSWADVNICKNLPSLCEERVYLVCNELGIPLPDLDEYGIRLPA
jgi:hypothetical protein